MILFEKNVNWAIKVLAMGISSD